MTNNFNKVKQKEEFQVLFKNNFAAVFKLLTCIDIYMFTIRMDRLLSQVSFNIDPKCKGLILKINKLSEKFIASDMNYLLTETESASTKILSEDWPMSQIIKKCFPEYIDGKLYKNIGTITDFYLLENEFTNSLMEYEKFPEVMKSAKYVDDSGNLVTLEFMSNVKKDSKLKCEKIKRNNLEKIKYIAEKYALLLE